MPVDTENIVKLSELIHWVKKDLLSDEAFRDNSIPLFVIDEVTVEVSFVLSGGGKAGLNLQVITAGTEVTAERVQKATVHLKPLVPYERVRERLEERHLKHFEDKVVTVIVKGLDSSNQDVPPRE